MTDEGKDVVAEGSYESRVYSLIPQDGGIEQGKLMASCGTWGKIGFSKAMSNGWILIDKSQANVHYFRNEIKSLLFYYLLYTSAACLA